MCLTNYHSVSEVWRVCVYVCFILILGNRTAVLLLWRVLPKSQQAALHLRWASSSSFMAFSWFPWPSVVFCDCHIYRNLPLAYHMSEFLFLLDLGHCPVVLVGFFVGVFVLVVLLLLLFFQTLLIFQCSPAGDWETTGEFYLLAKTVFTFTFNFTKFLSWTNSVLVKYFFISSSSFLAFLNVAFSPAACSFWTLAFICGLLPLHFLLQ